MQTGIKGLDRPFRRFYNELSFKFAKCPAQHIKPILNMGNDRFFFGQLQSPGLQEITDEHFRFLRDFFCSCCYDKVIGVAHQVDLVGIFEPQVDFTPAVGMKPVCKYLLHSVQRHICQNGGNDAALGRTFLGREQLIAEYKSRFQKLPEHRFVHRDMFNQPVVADMVKTAFDVTLHEPADTVEAIFD